MKNVLLLHCVCLSLLIFAACSNSADKSTAAHKKNEEDSTQKDSEQPLRKEDNTDNACNPRLCELISINNKASQRQMDSMITFMQGSLNCYCIFEGTRKKFGAHLPVVKEFVRNKYRTYSYALTPLQIACQNNDMGLVKKMLEKGAEANLTQTSYMRPMLIALRNKNTKMLELLARYKGSLENCYIDVKSMTLPELKLAKKYGADFNIKDDFFMVPPIQEAIGYSERKYMLESGANPNDINKDGQTLLHHLVFYGDARDIHLALIYKADLYIKDKRGFTPLHLAATSAFSDKLALLLPMYDLKKADITIDELIKISRQYESKACVEYLEKNRYKYIKPI
ncbi:MAG: hypothetical protein NZ529_08500 [Cytophagaceae bacterium]|nr:hypothetical protein [Cytophagaceae bacterium]MDW8456822.1 hypothetical protein [Cytophagaceae bacterium]